MVGRSSHVVLMFASVVKLRHRSADDGYVAMITCDVGTMYNFIHENNPAGTEKERMQSKMLSLKG